ncbi:MULTISPECIES: hypothetical protein [unclassified Pseudomonas]|jgi:hypothetical protein
MEIELDGVTLVSGLGVGVFVIIYVIAAWRRNVKPDLQQAVILGMSWAGFATTANLGLQVAVSKASDLGVLADQRVTIWFGVAAVMWVSITTMYGVFVKLRDDAGVRSTQSAPS